MAILVDTNILLRSVQPHHSHYPIVERAFSSGTGRGHVHESLHTLMWIARILARLSVLIHGRPAPSSFRVTRDSDGALDGGSESSVNTWRQGRTYRSEERRVGKECRSRW